MTAGILVTPPAGYEVSLSSGSGYASTITVGAAGTIASTTVYVRLAATTVVGSYSGDIVCSSSGATPVNVATVSSTVSKAVLTITAGNQSVTYGTLITTVTGAGAYTVLGYVNGENLSVISGTATYTTTYTETTAVGTTGVTITPSGLSATNYSFTYVNGTITITAATATLPSCRTDVSGFATWTDVGLAGTTYLQLLDAGDATTTPIMNFDAFSGETLNYDVRTYGGTTAAEILLTISISINNGSSWSTVLTYSPTSSSLYAAPSVDLTQVAVNPNEMVAVQ